ncbi:MAG TPA: folylpolyglutamate synthase/dihydrofolate synthase family protein [Candidatus Woesebacteria bacterium]|nr:folylpolyglutamate synthase/dihydrofolate synthase family protein [Candidatus Woesebacteria bacterium]
MKLSSYNQAEQYLNQFIPKTNKWGEPSFAHNRTKFFMKLLGDPQNKLKVIHIAGTSGKGSTSYITSTLLASQGLKVGMGISPHIHHILERIQINTKPISEELFVKYLNEIQPFIEETKNSEHGQITYFEAIVGLSYYIFFKEQVDVVVMEVGLGGRYDATNTVTSENKIAVITRIGYDHMEFLGNTLAEIALEKAKIIQKHNIVIKLKQEPEVMDVIGKESKAKEANLSIINPETIVTERKSTLLGLKCSLHYQNYHLEDIKVSLIGEYQFENLAMAFAVFSEYLYRNKKTVQEESLKNALQKIKIPGRMEMVHYKDREFIIDGAHNPQKMAAFIKSLTDIYKEERFTFVLSFKKGKNYQPILQLILPFAQDIILTSFDNTNQGMGELYSEDPQVLADLLKKMNYFYFQVIPDLKEALQKAQESNYLVVITGSLYLIGEVYKLIDSSRHSELDSESNLDAETSSA